MKTPGEILPEEAKKKFDTTHCKFITSFVVIAELIVCLTIESHRCGSRRFDRYTVGLHQAMVSTGCVTV